MLMTGVYTGVIVKIVSHIGNTGIKKVSYIGLYDGKICYIIFIEQKFVIAYLNQYIENQNDSKQWVSKSCITELQVFKQSRVALQKLQIE